METKNEILALSIDFAKTIISYTELLESHKKYVIANQLLKSGTSVGANVFEVQSSESRVDFIHKMKIADKEAKETEYWLLSCKDSDSYPFDDSLPIKLLSIQKLLSKIISTAKKH
ncbi:four helix bundle protein [Chryseobacterium sp. T1]